MSYTYADAPLTRATRLQIKLSFPVRTHARARTFGSRSGTITTDVKVKNNTKRTEARPRADARNTNTTTRSYGFGCAPGRFRTMFRTLYRRAREQDDGLIGNGRAETTSSGRQK